MTVLVGQDDLLEIYLYFYPEWQSAHWLADYYYSFWFSWEVGGGIGGEERWECPSVISKEHYKIAQGLPAAEWADESVLGCDLITAAVEVVRWGEVIASDNIY